MPRRSLLQGQVRGEIAAIERRQLTPEEYGSAVLEALASLVPYDDARFFGVDPGSLLLNRLIASSERDGPFRAYWLRHIYLSHLGEAYFGPHELMRVGARAVAYLPRKPDCWGVPEQLLEAMTPVEHYRYFHESRTPLGGSLRLCIRARGQWIGMLDLVRRESLTPMSAREFSVFADLATLIGRGLDAAFMREAARMRAPTIHYESGVVVVGEDRRISYATPAGERYLAALSESDRQDGLATPILAVLRAAEHRIQFGRLPTIDVTSRLGPLHIEATSGSEPGSWAFVIAPLYRMQQTTVPLHWPLTDRQRQVAEKLLQGASAKAIARDLFISVPTVESHIGHIYDALEVSGRTDLLALFFRQTILPGIDAEGHPFGD